VGYLLGACCSFVPNDFSFQVSWSHLTPYRLVTAGHDGFARTWDIREAALKRNGAVIGKRPEYSLKLTDEEKETNLQLRRGMQQAPESGNSVSLPPLPERPANPPANAADGGPVPDVPMPDQAPVPPAPPLPLPPAAPPVEGEAQNNGEADDNSSNNNIAPGRFVANDMIDEGVQLLAKFQHGASIEERSAAPGTRSRRAAVKVLCVHRCPLGGHFATGADDGICRVWEDTDDVDVETVDHRSTKSSFEWMAAGQDLSKERNRRRSCKLLLLLSRTRIDITNKCALSKNKQCGHRPTVCCFS
jgi:WD40 repeat protein